MNKSSGFRCERMLQIDQMVVGWRIEYEGNKGDNEERPKI